MSRRPVAVLVPGWGGRATSPILQRSASALESAGFAALPIELERSPRPSPHLEREVEALRRVVDDCGASVLVGRSFGGRVCARLATERELGALIVIGHPIRPPGRPRPEDEAALAAVRCRTLILQGGADPLGPLRVLRAIAKKNPRVELEVFRGEGHVLRAKAERAAIARMIAWLRA